MDSNLSYEQVKTLLGSSGNPVVANDRKTTANNNNCQKQQPPTTTTANNNNRQQQPPTTRNAASNNSELEPVKKYLRPLLFNNKHVKVEEFKLDFDSFALTRGHFGAVHARTLVANPKNCIKDQPSSHYQKG
jgi:hypothetical protein